jgi:hypothetical protein
MAILPQAATQVQGNRIYALFIMNQNRMTTVCAWNKGANNPGGPCAARLFGDRDDETRGATDDWRSPFRCEFQRTVSISGGPTRRNPFAALACRRVLELPLVATFSLISADRVARVAVRPEANSLRA